VKYANHIIHEQGEALADESLIKTIQAITIFTEYAAIHNGKYLKVKSINNNRIKRCESTRSTFKHHSEARD